MISESWKKFVEYCKADVEYTIKSRDTLNAQWLAIVVYRTDKGSNEFYYFLHEIGDLEEIIEGGPHFDTVAKIEIQRINHIDSKT